MTRIDATGLLTMNQIARRAGVSSTAVLDWVKRGKLKPALEVTGHLVLFSEEDVAGWLAVWPGRPQDIRVARQAQAVGK